MLCIHSFKTCCIRMCSILPCIRMWHVSNELTTWKHTDLKYATAITGSFQISCSIMLQRLTAGLTVQRKLEHHPTAKGIDPHEPKQLQGLMRAMPLDEDGSQKVKLKNVDVISSKHLCLRHEFEKFSYFARHKYTLFSRLQNAVMQQSSILS